jgi:nickel/cobalt exporter
MIFKRESAKLLVPVGAVPIFAGTIDAAFEQAFPFSNPEGAQLPALSASALVSIFATQSDNYREFSALVRIAGADERVVWGIIGFSFLYGVFQAAAPGYSKGVISSHLIANLETWRRSLASTFASALLQATVGVAVVAFCSALLRAIATRTGSAVDLVELVSYALILLIGLRLSWIKGRGFFITLRQVSSPMFQVGAALTPPTYEDRANCDNRHDRGVQPHEGPRGEGGRNHCRKYGRLATHDAPAVEAVEFTVRDGMNGLPAAFQVWIAPCSGAIVVLIFALAQGLFWLGITATFMMGAGSALTTAVLATVAVSDQARAARFAKPRTRYGLVAMRGIELGAAVAIILFGAFLLTGCMMSERLIAV